MTIANLIRRYKRWNPVHPTYGAFWGMGIGLGCGVGWGPGFGPEAVGFVGSGCGVGFSVGVTLIGIGIGLPASGFTNLPWNAFDYIAKQGWEALSSQAIALDRVFQNLSKTQIPRSQRFLLESRKRFLKRVQESQKKAVTPDNSVLQMEPLDINQERGPHTMPVPAHRRVPGRDFLPPASRVVQPGGPAEETERKK